jgi:predicted methyltransferase
MDTCEEAIEAARGKVVTFGLGLGYYAYMASRKPNVESVTVVERSEEVIELFKRHILPHFDFPEKINIVCSDAFEYAKGRMPQEKFDVAFVDIWRDASDGAPIYKEMKSLEPLSPGTKFLYWIENFLISRLRAEKFAKITNDYDNGRLELTYEEILGKLREIP